MKYIFCVHSPITYLTTFLTVKQENIPVDDVIVYLKNYKIPHEYFRTVPTFDSLNQGLIDKLKNFNTGRSHDKYINQITDGTDFKVFVPTIDVFEKLLITHGKCVSFNFIEEGMLSYLKSTKLSHLYRNFKFSNRIDLHKNLGELKRSIVYLLRGITLRILELPFTYEAYANIEGTNFYTLSPSGFPVVQNEKRRILKIDSSDSNLQKLSANTSYENQVIWLEDSYYRHNGIDESVYINALEAGLKNLKHVIGQRKILVKLRPNDSGNSSPLVRVLKNNQVEFDFIQNNLVMEVLLATSKDCVVVGNVSSCLFYANILGHKSYSIYNLFSEHSNRVYNNFPVFWKNIKRV